MLQSAQIAQWLKTFISVIDHDLGIYSGSSKTSSCTQVSPAYASGTSGRKSVQTKFGTKIKEIKALHLLTVRILLNQMVVFWHVWCILICQSFRCATFSAAMGNFPRGKPRNHELRIFPKSQNLMETQTLRRVGRPARRRRGVGRKDIHVQSRAHRKLRYACAATRRFNNLYA